MDVVDLSSKKCNEATFYVAPRRPRRDNAAGAPTGSGGQREAGGRFGAKSSSLAPGHVARRMLAVLLLTAGCWLVLSWASLARIPAGPFKSYVLDPDNIGVPSLVSFAVDGIVDGTSLGIGAFSWPEDLFLGPDGYVYLADKRNNRVVKLTEEGQLVMQFGAPPQEGTPGLFGEDGDPLKSPYLNEPSGVFVGPDLTVYVADTENQRIALFDKDGRFLSAVGAPTSPLLEKGFTFRPSKLVMDTAGVLYVINGSDYRGLVQMTVKGEFLGWYAPNRLKFDLGRVVARILATADQLNQMSKPVPPPHANIFVDRKGFLWSLIAAGAENQIKHIVSGGKNVFPEQAYGQVFWGQVLLGEEVRSEPRFSDLAVDDRGVLTVLDRANELLYQYNTDGDLLFVYGGPGNQKGLFRGPSSVIVDSRRRLWVLDSVTGLIQILRPTAFGELVYKASSLYARGFYKESADAWKQVATLNPNYRLARRGLGLAYMKQQRWRDAMRELYLGRYRGEFSQAFGRYLQEYMRGHFGLVSILALGACLALYGIVVGWKAAVRYAIREVHGRWQ